MKNFVSFLLNTAVKNKQLLEGRVPPALRDLVIKALLEGSGEM